MSTDKTSRWLLTFADGSWEEIDADRVARVPGKSGIVAVYEWTPREEHGSHERLVCTLEGVAKLERLTRPALW